MNFDIEKFCEEKGVVMTEQRKIIARAIFDSVDHPDVETLHRRALLIDSNISIATIYRTLKLFEEIGAVNKHDFGNNRARYEIASDDHHDHLIDVRNGKIIEFSNEEIEKLQESMARNLGYKLIGHKLELYAVPLDD